MKKIFYVLLACSAAFAGCQKAEIITSENHSTEPALTSVQDSYRYNEGSIVLGKQIEIPYSVSNLKKALELVSPETRSAINEDDIVPTHYYVKFSPENEAELSILKNDPKLILSEYPLDREILVDGCSYHDPSLPADMPTYQYSTIEASYWKALSDTLSVRSEVLIEAFMPDYYDDDVETKAGQGIDPSALENLMETAYKMTGHEYMPETKAAKWFPSGRITAYDNIVGGQVPIKRLRVRGTHLLKTIEALTNDNGEYSFPHSFKNKADMKIVWESDRWDIRDGNVAQAYFNGPKIYGQPWNVDIYNGDLKALRYAAIHRAAFRHYFGNNCGLSRPDNSRKEKIAYIHDDIDKGGTNGDYNQQWGMGVWSDIRIAGRNSTGWRLPSEIFSTTCHEIGHAAHYTNAGSTYRSSEDRVLESWARFVQYILTRQEYSEFGKKYLCDIVTKNGKVYESADLDYNFQYRDNQEDSREYYAKYTPVLIDLVDDYNQFLYYDSKDPEIHPNDEIKGFPAKEVENMTFSSRTFDDIKTKLKAYASNFPNNQYNITSSNVDAIFSVY